jgi:hypothetical protein
MDWYEWMIEDEWDRAEAEMLEQVNLATGERTVNLTRERSAPLDPPTPPDPPPPSPSASPPPR